MRVAIIGSGGREHALAWKIEQDQQGRGDVFVLPGNGGTANTVPIEPTDLGAIEAFCLERAIDLVVVGPEAPLVAGIVDRLSARGLRVFGPTAAGARLEGSKVWAKRFMRRHGVPTADFQVFGDPSDALAYAREIGGDAVVKLDGLAAGKGVFVCRGLDEVAAAISSIRETWGNDAPFLIERRLTGNELSVIGFTDGEHVALLQPSQDHKQVFDGDRGPNTGGMGAFCPVPACDAAMLGQIREQVVEPTMHGLRAEGIDYRGVIYFGLMITPSGPRVLEYNVRLGDPEAEVVLPALESSLLEVMDACIDRTLDRCEPRFTPGFHVDVVLAARGYPDAYERGHEITGLDAVDPGTLVFHAGTRREAGRVLTAGGRVLNVVARGDDLDDAIARAYRQCGRIRFEGKHLRSDIGRRKWWTPGGDDGKSCGKSFEEGVRGSDFSSEKFFPRERRPRRVAILISGRGSNMEAIVRNARDGVLRDCCEVALVLSDRADAAGLEIARSLGVETACLESRGRRRTDFDRALVELLDRYELDYLVLAGFMRVLTPIVIDRYRDRIINIHPADTRAYQGAHGYEWAFENRLLSTAITVHLVDEGVDTGRVIAQREVDLRGADTIDEVRRRGLAVEHGFYSEALRTVLTDSRPRPRPRSDEEA